MGDRLGIPCVLSIFSFLYGVFDPIEFIFGTFGPLGGLLVAKKRLIGVGFEGEKGRIKGAPVLKYI